MSMQMAIGYSVLEMRLPGNSSLKGKRRVVKSVIERVKGRYNVSIGEVGDQDVWQSVVLGVSCVSTTEAHCRETLETVADYVHGSRLDVELVHQSIDVIHP